MDVVNIVVNIGAWFKKKGAREACGDRVVFTYQYERERSG